MAARRVPKAGLIAAVAIVLLMFLMAKRPIPEEELARRVAQSAPSWNNYDEDLKASSGRPLSRSGGQSSDSVGRRGLKVGFSLRAIGRTDMRSRFDPVCPTVDEHEPDGLERGPRSGLSFPASWVSPQMGDCALSFLRRAPHRAFGEGTLDSGEN